MWGLYLKFPLYLIASLSLHPFSYKMDDVKTTWHFTISNILVLCTSLEILYCFFRIETCIHLCRVIVLYCSAINYWVKVWSTSFFLKSFFFLMWTIFKVFIELVTILLLFYVLVFWPRGMWDLTSPTRDRTLTPCIGRLSLNHWTAREVPEAPLLKVLLRKFSSVFLTIFKITVLKMLLILLCCW